MLPPSGTWHVPTSVTMRTWRVPAVTQRTDDDDTEPVRPSGQGRGWHVPIMYSPPSDLDSRARAVLRPAAVVVTGIASVAYVPDDSARSRERGADELAEPAVHDRLGEIVEQGVREWHLQALAEVVQQQLTVLPFTDRISEATVDANSASVEIEPVVRPRLPSRMVPEPAAPQRETEHGDRWSFLAAARQQIATESASNSIHPAPLFVAPDVAAQVELVVPEPEYRNLSRDDVVGSFARAVEDAGGVCHRVVGDIPETLLDHFVAELDAWDAVVSSDPEAAELARRLASRGVDVSPASTRKSAVAAIGITSAVVGVAATGSLVLDSHRDGGRLVSVLPRVHLCVLPAERLVATPADVLRSLGQQSASGDLPSSLVLVSGPCRTGDIEQLLTIGAPGPTALHVIVVEPEPS